MTDSFRTRAGRVFWERHANPWSGWTRTLTLPTLVRRYEDELETLDAP